MNRRILLVEDSPEIQQLVTLFLEDEGFDISTASNGVDALKFLAQSELPDLILLDSLMPEMDGTQFLAEIAKHPDARLRQIPIVLMSALRENEINPRGLTGFLRKPFRFESLVEAVQSALAGKRIGLSHFDSQEQNVLHP